MFYTRWEVAYMTLFDVAKKNVIGNFKNYLLYFVSMIFSVVIYYTFVSLRYSPEVQKAIESSDSILNIFIAGSLYSFCLSPFLFSIRILFFTKKR